MDKIDPRLMADYMIHQTLLRIPKDAPRKAALSYLVYWLQHEFDPTISANMISDKELDDYKLYGKPIPREKALLKKAKQEFTEAQKLMANYSEEEICELIYQLVCKREIKIGEK